MIRRSLPQRRHAITRDSLGAAASLRVATGAPALVAVAARSARRPARAPIPAAARDPVLPTLLSGRAPPLSRDGDGSRCRRPPQSST